MSTFWTVAYWVVGVTNLLSSFAWQYIDIMPNGNLSSGENAVVSLIIAFYCFISLDIDSIKKDK
jgi:hypothetical protein